MSTSTITRLLGSAPHMRGIPATARVIATAGGISSAHAGNTDFPCRVRCGRSDQPRTCGEYVVVVRGVDDDYGSAPHMRGILWGEGGCRAGLGISPAHAGNTQTLTGSQTRVSDQPRTCGEYCSSTAWVWGWSGSAPHMRGIPTATWWWMAFTRISPAHAGNTRTSRPAPLSPRDQPRTCGEYDDTTPVRTPRTGISPAHAGNTSSCVHPSP